MSAGTGTLDPGTTKNGEGRTIYMTAALRTLLEAQKAAGEVLAQQEKIVPNVFHRNAKPIRGFYKRWRKACESAGCPGKLLHDFRRTAVRNYVGAGIPERVAMSMSGHKTRSVFDRYDIVSPADLKLRPQSWIRPRQGQTQGQSRQAKPLPRSRRAVSD